MSSTRARFCLACSRRSSDKPLPGFKASDACCLFDNRAPVMRLGTKQLPDALLLDDGVGFRAEAGAHEDVLNIAQAAKFAVEQIFALAGTKQAAGDDDLALPGRGSLEAPAANFQHHWILAGGLHYGGRLVRLLRPDFRPRNLLQGPGLHLGDGLFCLRGPLGPDLLFIPVDLLRLAMIVVRANRAGGLPRKPRDRSAKERLPPCPGICVPGFRQR